MTKITLTTSTPNPDVIAELEGALERAKSGAMQDVAIAARLTGGDHYTSYCTKDIFILVSILEHMKFRLLMAGREAS